MEMKAPQFDLGQTVITANAQCRLCPADVLKALARHVRGDWGDVCLQDREANVEALRNSERLLSVYHDQNGNKFYVITEGDSSSTTVLLPEDY